MLDQLTTPQLTESATETNDQRIIRHTKTVVYIIYWLLRPYCFKGSDILFIAFLSVMYWFFPNPPHPNPRRSWTRFITRHVLSIASLFVIIFVISCIEPMIRIPLNTFLGYFFTERSAYTIGFIIPNAILVYNFYYYAPASYLS